MNKLTPEEKKRLNELLQETLKKPPMIGLVGVSGVGKSSTINTMFKTNLPISHTKACTTEFRQIPLELRMTHGPAVGKDVELIVCDAPGLGEDIHKDPKYLDMYRENLPKCDMILWIMSARNRAIALDQSYLKEFLDLSERIVFGISQVDLVEPMNWKPGLPIPSKEQEKYITEIIADRTKRLTDFLERKVEIIPYSNYRGYNLETLFTSLLQSCTGNRSWIFGGLKNFNYEDFIPSELQEILESKKNMEQKNKDKKENWNNFESGSVKEQFLDLFTMPNHLKEVIKKLIGRDNIDEHPLTEDEINLVQSWLEKIKKSNQ